MRSSKEKVSRDTIMFLFGICTVPRADPDNNKVFSHSSALKCLSFPFWRLPAISSAGGQNKHAPPTSISAKPKHQTTSEMVCSQLPAFTLRWRGALLSFSTILQAEITRIETATIKSRVCRCSNHHSSLLSKIYPRPTCKRALKHRPAT